MSTLMVGAWPYVAVIASKHHASSTNYRHPHHSHRKSYITFFFQIILSAILNPHAPGHSNSRCQRGQYTLNMPDSQLNAPPNPGNNQNSDDGATIEQEIETAIKDFKILLHKMLTELLQLEALSNAAMISAEVDEFRDRAYSDLRALIHIIRDSHLRLAGIHSFMQGINVASRRPRQPTNATETGGRDDTNIHGEQSDIPSDIPSSQVEASDIIKRKPHDENDGSGIRNKRKFEGDQDDVDMA